MTYVAVIIVAFVAGVAFYHFFLARKIGCSGRPASPKRLWRMYWYSIVATTGPRTISVVDPEESEGKENPISIKLSLVEMEEAKNTHWMRWEKVDRKWVRRFYVTKPPEEPKLAKAGKKDKVSV